MDVWNANRMITSAWEMCLLWVWKGERDKGRLRFKGGIILTSNHRTVQHEHISARAAASWDAWWAGVWGPEGGVHSASVLCYHVAHLTGSHPSFSTWHSRLSSKRGMMGGESRVELPARGRSTDSGTGPCKSMLALALTHISASVRSLTFGMDTIRPSTPSWLF